MNYGVVKRILGVILILEALFMLPSFLISIYLDQVDKSSFLISIVLTIAIGYILSRQRVENKSIKVKEGLTIVSLGWILISFFGSLPFVFSKSVPSFIDAFFETVSGFTTTGATIINNVEALPKGILFWRSFTHWIGGMGILVFTVALLPAMGIGGFQVFKAESPGPTADKFVPKIKDTAKFLYTAYILITIIQILLLIFGGMSLYESIVHTFGTVGTGGFSTRSASIGSYNSTYIHLVISVFMLLAGSNFSIYYSLYKGKWRDIFKSQEIKLYFGIVFIAVFLISLDLIVNIYDNIGLALRDAFFQVSSIITTTGYATVNYDIWPAFSKSILFFLLFIGGCAGSTAGGMKTIRILVLLKLIKREIAMIFHPKAIIPIRNESRIIKDETVSSIASFFALYILIFVLGTIVISLEGIGFESAASAVAATLGNVGPGFGFVGPTRTFSEFHTLSKILFSVFMLLGRLELFTVIALVAPKTWRNEV